MGDFSVSGRRVVVVGAARSGVAAAELLASRGARVVVTDIKPAIPDEGRLRSAGIEVELGDHRPDLLASAELIVVSPGVPLDQPAFSPASRLGISIIGELELASRWLAGRIVAITGTKGKSTTTALTGRILESAGLDARVCGNIGAPVSMEVPTATPDTVHVIEVSSFQLETTDTFRPWISVLLNFTPDHLDRHTSVDDYRRAKMRVFARQMPDDWAVVNGSDPEALAMSAATRAQRLLFSVDSQLDEGIVVRAGEIVHRTKDREVALVPLSAVRLVGRHLLSDVLAAVAVGRLAGAPPAAMLEAIESFKGLEHVMEPVGEIDGVRFVNDSKATNVESARCSMANVPGRVVPIIGGRYKGGDLTLLRSALSGRAPAIIAIGESKGLVRETLGDLAPVQEAESMTDAVVRAFGSATAGDTVLLAPACSSFDMFDDYAHRGRVFRREVEALSNEIRRGREG
jgi:UDP-N-acetylmuramoylalanine--D-glutamate ligase